MKKNIIEDRLATPLIQSMQPQDLSSRSVMVQVQQVIEEEKARRQSSSRQLDVLEYQPCEQDSALHLVQGWHLLFFARAGTTHMQELRAALQQESGRDLQLMQYFKRVQAQYRQHAAQSSETHTASLPTQPVIAEIRYGGLTIVPGFWLPADMEMGLSLLPAIGGHLAADGMTLVEYLKDQTNVSLDVLMVTAATPYTKAEQAALRLHPEETRELAQEKRTFTLSTPAALLTCIVTCEGAAVAASALAFLVAIAIGGVTPEGPDTDLVGKPLPPADRADLMRRRKEGMQSLGFAPSVPQLLELRQQLLTGRTH